MLIICLYKLNICIIFAVQTKTINQMKQATITIRVDQNLKDKFDNLCEDFGLSITSAFNIFMKAVVREKRIPFEIQSSSTQDFALQGANALSEMRRIVAESNQPEMNLDEINDFIRQVRDETSR